MILCPTVSGYFVLFFQTNYCIFTGIIYELDPTPPAKPKQAKRVEHPLSCSKFGNNMQQPPTRAYF